MKAPNTIIKEHFDYTIPYSGLEKDYFQIHIFSVPKTVSTYYNPKEVTLEQIENIIEGLLKHLKKGQPNIYCFSQKGKYLICENENIIDFVECLTFNVETVQYEYIDDNADFELLVGFVSPGEFIETAVINFGAPELVEVMKSQLNELKENYKRRINEIEENRKLDKESPLLKLEVHQINRNLSTTIIFEYNFHNSHSIYILPEVTKHYLNKENVTLIIRDLKSNKIIEGNLREAINDSSFENMDNYLRDPDDYRRAELDDDDPDFLYLD